MQSFQKKLIKKSSSRKSEQLMDDYQKQVYNTSRKVGQIQKLSLTELSTSSQLVNFMGRTYTMLFTLVISSAIVYPLSVRIVKSVFGLRSFFNVHFAAVPIIANWNAFVIGVAQGYVNYSAVVDKYPAKQDETMKSLESLLN